MRYDLSFIKAFLFVEIGFSGSADGPFVPFARLLLTPIDVCVSVAFIAVDFAADLKFAVAAYRC
jgi:hypothetical protein